MPKYDAVVIGAGNGGLAAACRMAKGGKKDPAYRAPQYARRLRLKLP